VFSEVGISKGVVDILLAHALNREARLTVLKEKGRYHVVDLIVDGEVLWTLYVEIGSKDVDTIHRDQDKKVMGVYLCTL
jgi:hypothetical protein